MIQNTGKVVLAGAGPGDAELITVKLQKRLMEADVILADRLVNPEIFEQYASSKAIIITTGKEGFNKASYTQKEICDLIVKYALEGKNVLRLKGGDVAFFSNVLDELLAIEKHNLKFEIIPGITAASGCSAYTGIPLTARGYSQGVEFVTYNPNSSYSEETWHHFANCNETLIFYMAIKNITNLSDKLLSFNKNPETPIALVEQATTKYQKVHVTTLKNCKMDFESKQFTSPSLVIIGDVVKLYNRFNWLNATDSGSVFNKL